MGLGQKASRLWLNPCMSDEQSPGVRCDAGTQQTPSQEHRKGFLEAFFPSWFLKSTPITNNDAHVPGKILALTTGDRSVKGTWALLRRRSRGERRGAENIRGGNSRWLCKRGICSTATTRNLAPPEPACGQEGWVNLLEVGAAEGCSGDWRWVLLARRQTHPP